MNYFERIIRKEIHRKKQEILSVGNNPTSEILDEIQALEKLIEHTGRIEAVCKFPNAEILFGDDE